MKTYPICLIGLENRSAVVIGGGEVAVRKVMGLVEAGAQVTVISPKCNLELINLQAAGRIKILPRPYQAGDLAGAFVAIAATNDALVNEAIWQEASQSDSLVNVVDDPLHSNFIVPAVVRRGELNIAITTGGGSPALARRLREKLADAIGPEYGEMAALLAELRPQLLASFSPGSARLQAALQLIDSQLLEIIRQQGREAACQYAEDFLEQIAQPEITETGFRRQNGK
jgi:precorrin-2 dehydrogenase/sirohydrochlorin ferrochelatase